MLAGIYLVPGQVTIHGTLTPLIIKPIFYVFLLLKQGGLKYFMTEQILQTIEDNIAVITFNRPDVLNAFSFEMRERFACIVEELAKDDDVRCIVITGNGRAFSAGGDIKGWGDLKDENKMKLLSQFVHRAVKGLIYMENGMSIPPI